MGFTKSRKRYVGSEAIDRKGILSLSHPIQNGRIVDWDDMKSLWEFAMMDALKIIPEEHEILVCEPAMNEKDKRGLIAEIFFETFNVPALFIAKQPLLSVYGTGSHTGLVVDIGEGGTRCVPIWQGHMLEDRVQSNILGGFKMTEYMGRLMSECDQTVSQMSQYMVAEMKTSLAYVAQDFDKELKDKLAEKTEFMLPDGQLLQVASQRFRCCEAFFQPEVLGEACDDLPSMIYDTIASCDMDLRRDLFNNIILVGGCAKFPGLQQRVTKELQLRGTVDVNVKIPEDPEYSVWKGGSILSSVEAFSNHWVTSAHYEEYGAQAFD